MKHFLLIFAILLTLTQVSCSYLSPHQYDIPQGNIIEMEKLNQLKTGMDKKQVQFLLGTPMLQDIFHPNRWDYIYYLKKTNNQKEFQRLSILFQKGKVAEIYKQLDQSLMPSQNDSEIVNTANNTEGKWYDWMFFWNNNQQQ